MKVKAILSGLTIGNAIIDLGNNAYNFSEAVSKQEHIDIKDFISTDISASLLDFTVLAIEFCPIPQVKVAGILLNLAITAADGYAVAKDANSKVNENTEISHIIKFSLDLVINGADVGENFPNKSLKGSRIFANAGIMLANLMLGKETLDDYAKRKGIEESEDDRITEITIYVPADNFIFAPGERTIKIPTKYLEDQGIVDNGGINNDANFGNNDNKPNGNSDNTPSDNPQSPGNNPNNQPQPPGSSPNNGSGNGNGNGSKNGGSAGIDFDPPILKKLKDLLDRLRKAIDPVVLNLSEEGKANGLGASFVYFDYDGDGFAERTGWIGEQQGLLVVDLNENGIIDDGKELFGDKTILKNGRQAKDGYQALKELDENKDGVIDSQDSAWLKLRVWVDNGDGMTQEGELKTLEELGIESIKLNEERNSTSEDEGNILEKIGFFTKADGTTGELSDYTFEVNEIDTYNKNQVEVSEEVAEEIYLPESGMLENSWQIMMKSENEDLKNLLRQYQETTGESEKSEILDQILCTMAGNKENSSSRGNYMDARKLNVIEKFYGTKYNGGNNPTKWTAPLLSDLYDNIKRYYEGWISAQTTAAEYLTQIAIVIDVEAGEIRIDFSEVKEMLEAKIADNFEEGKKDLSELANAMQSIGLSGNEEYQKMCQEIISENDELAEAIYSAGRNMIVGTEENGSLYSNAGNSIIIGGEGQDTIKAHGTDVIIIGGKDDDKLYGSRGDDPNYYGEYDGTEKVTYVWNKGDGNDTITNASNLQRAKETGGTAYLRMGSGITLENLKFVRDKSENAYIQNTETGEEITIVDWFKDDVFKLDGIVFADGTVLNREELIEKVSKFETTEGDDTLIGNASDDTLDGGAGNDYLEGGYGDDTYIWGTGSGNDTINNVIKDWAKRFVDSGKNKLVIKGVSSDELDYRAVGSDLVIENKERGETLTVNQFFQSKYNQIEEIEFEDGSIMTNEELKAKAQITEGTSADDTIQGNDLIDDIILGKEGNDSLYGLKGNDTLNGGEGEDYLEGGYGDDTYIWGNGYGNDTINNTILNWVGNALDSGKDKLEVKGAKADELSFKVSNNDLVIENLRSGEKLTVKQFFFSEYSQLEKIIFEDGTIITSEEIIQKAQTTRGTNVEDKLEGGDADDIILGEGGNDSLYGLKGDDTLDGGAGDDYLEGGYGDDTYIWGTGSGNDTISNVIKDWAKRFVDSGKNKLVIKGVSSDGLDYRAVGSDLVIENKERGETLTVSQFFQSKYNQIEEIEFEDGSIMTNEELKARAQITEGTSADDTIQGNDLIDDIILGKEGNDSLYGLKGNDTLNGGAGNDYLEGGYGDDTYIWGVGSGNDTINNTIIDWRGSSLDSGKDILEINGLVADELSFKVLNNDLVIENKATGENLTVKQFFLSEYSQFDKVIFEDGTVMTSEEISQRVQVSEGTSNADILKGGDIIDDIILGKEGNDSLYGLKGNDTLDGGAGNDYLEGGYGDDTYIWGTGSGNDTINNVIKDWAKRPVDSGNDTLKFTEEVSCSDVLWRSDKDDMLATLCGTGEVLRIKDWNRGENCRIDEIIFADGEIFSADEIDQCIKAFENNSTDITVYQNSQSGIILQKNI